MKILYLITKSNWGGAQRHVYDIATYSHKMGHEVVVALGGEGMLKERLEKAQIRTITLTKLGRDVNVGNDLSSTLELFKIVHKEKPEVLHVHSAKAGGIGAFVGRIMRVPKVIFTAHGWTFNEDRPWHQKGAIIFFS